MLTTILSLGLIIICLSLVISHFLVARINLRIVEKTQALVFVENQCKLNETEVTRKTNLSNLHYSEQYNEKVLAQTPEENQAEAESPEDLEDAWMYQGNRRSSVDLV